MAQKIVIAGAGYAGLMCALRLAGKTANLDVTVTLINGTDVFIERPRLHEVATNQGQDPTPLRHLLRGASLHFIKGWLTRINPAQQSLTVRANDQDRIIEYDYLVYALGSRIDTDSVPGVHQHAYVLHPHGENSAEALRQKLLALNSGQVVVVGGGATGIEGAAQIRSIYPQLDVRLVTSGRFGTFKGARVEKHLRDGLAKLGIPVMENQTVSEVQAHQLMLHNGETVYFDVCLWAGGFVAPTTARAANIKVNDRHQILADPYLRSVSHPNIYVAGDAAAPVEEPGNPYRLSLNTALTSGAHVADNIVRLLKGKPQQPLSFVYYGQGIAMGTEDAIGFNGYPDDMPHGPILRGKLAVRVRNFFVWLIMQMLFMERRFPGFFFWPGRGRYDAQRNQRRSQSFTGKSV